MLSDKQKKAYELLGHFDTAMLVTTSADGSLDARPMQLAEIDGQGTIWLLASTRSRKADEIRAAPNVLLVCQDNRRQYLSLRGTARLVDDRQHVERLWQPSYKLWLAEGPRDPHVALIAIDPGSVEFWDNTGVHKLKYLWEAAKILAGEPAEPALKNQHASTKM